MRAAVHSEGPEEGGIMKKHIGLAAIAFALLGAADPTASSSQAETLATKRHVAGVITSIDTQSTTIASAQNAVSGKIDPQRTKVTVHGKPGSIADLKLTAHAKGELCLEDVWLAIDIH
jgi:hypothetical protein